MALFLDVNGDLIFIKPRKSTFSLQELYKHLQCDLIQTIELDNGITMIIDEEGKLKENSKFNFIGTFLFHKTYGRTDDCIVGHAIIVDESEFN